MNSALPQVVTTGPDSKLNSTAIDIFTLYAQMDSFFWIETINFGKSIVYINGWTLVTGYYFQTKLYFFLWRLFLS